MVTKLLDGQWKRYSSSVRWRLMPEGIEVEGDGIRGSGGEPVTVRRIIDRFGSSIEIAAAHYLVPAELIVATIATESGGNPNAERHEPGFSSYDATPGRVSIGLMQTLLSTARMMIGSDTAAQDLRTPHTSIMAGTAYINHQAPITFLDPPRVACAYNAGGVYPQAAEGNRWKMRQFPIGTGKHADRFVLWFNDCMAIYNSQQSPPRQSFVAAFRAAVRSFPNSP